MVSRHSALAMRVAARATSVVSRAMLVRCLIVVVTAAVVFGIAFQTVTVSPRYMIVVISRTRAHSVDYVSDLLRSLRAQDPNGSRARIVLFDTDQDGSRRSASWFASLARDTVVTRPSFEPLDLVLDRRRDKHRDAPERIRWRAKSARDMRDVLMYGAASEFRHVVVLEDDVRVASDFLDVLDRLVQEADARSVPWLAWTLMNAKDFDHGRTYAHGDHYTFEACTQGMLYNNDASFSHLIEHFSKVWRDDPTDWIIRDFQRATGAVIYVALPNIVQHVGTVSTLHAKNGVAVGCVSKSFRG